MPASGLTVAVSSSASVPTVATSSPVTSGATDLSVTTVAPLVTAGAEGLTVAGTTVPRLSLLAAFLLGLVGSVHCLGMCGPLVTLYADRMPSSSRGVPWAAVRQHALFNAGRTLAYAAVGAVLGALGATAFAGAELLAVGDQVRAVAGVAAGVVILVVGLGYLVRGTPVSTSLPSIPVVSRAFRAVHGLLADRVDDWASGPGVVALGGVHALLPCPLLYPAYLFALARGSPVEGGLTLAALGLGTFPTLFAYGTAFGSLDADLRRRLHHGIGVGFVLLATVPLAHGLGLVGVTVPTVPLHDLVPHTP